MLLAIWHESAESCPVRRRISVSISSLSKPIALATFLRRATIEKTILRFLGSSEFSHSLGQSRKYSRGADDFRSSPESGHYAVGSPRRFRADIVAKGFLG